MTGYIVGLIGIIATWTIDFMNSWWSLGEGSGHFGSELALYNIECVFCEEKGNWKLEHRSQKKKSNSNKVLNFDTYMCGSCSGYVMVMWSADDYGGSQGMHDYRVLPRPLNFQPSDNWPEAVGRHWKQAHDNLKSGNFDASVVMARSALQASLRSKGAKGKSLFDEIEDLSTKGIIPSVIKDWSHEVRLLAKPSAHPEPNDDEVSSKDARDIVEFLDYLLDYIFDLPASIEKYRQNNK